MKKMLLMSALIAGTMFASGQTNPNLIDFEPSTANLNGCGSYSQTEGSLLNNSFFQCAYGVTFHMGSLSGTAPTVAEVGAPTVAWASGTTFSYSSAKGCSVPASIGSDKPTNNRDMGCFFITDDNNGPGQNPASLYVDYHDLSCTEASGFLMDVDGSSTNNVQEGWKVTAYGTGGSSQTVYVLSPNYALYTTPPTPQVNLIGGDGEASYWGVNLGTDPIDYIVFEYIGHPSRNVGLAFDDFAICSSQPQYTDVPTRGCCDDIGMDNLIPNGSFEAGNVDFSSDYTYQGTIAANSVNVGQYTVANGSQANTISSCWDIADHTTCDPDDGRMLLVNGRTNLSGSATAYEQTEIEVEEGQEYIFCMYYKQLSQCAFDAFSPSNIQVVFDGVDEESTRINDCEDGSDDGSVDDDDDGSSSIDDCGWTKISYTIVPNSSTIDINVLLNEAVIGDGNDVAFDDISLRKKAEMPEEYCHFELEIEYNEPEMFLNAYASYTPLPSGFTVTWTVVEVDCATGEEIPDTEQSYTGAPDHTDFSWYRFPFEMHKCYRIKRSVSNCCYKDCEYEVTIGDIEGHDDEGKPTGNIMNGDATGSNLKVYPNPGDGHVTINAQASLQNAQLTVYSADGKVVLEQRINNEHNTNIDLSKLPNGVYSFNVSMKDGTTVTKTYVKQ